VGEERRAQQRQVMAVGTVLISINAVVFNLLPNPGYDAHLLFVVAALFVVVLGLAKYERLYYAVVNFCLLLLLAMLGHFALQTGGIQSSNMVWFCILSVPAMFFLGPRGGIIYLLVILALIASVFGLSLLRAPATTAVNQATVLFAVFNHIMAAASLMLMVRLYDHLTEQQIQESEKRNQALIVAHEDMRLTSAHKDEFVAAMGHELRTPMNAILGLNGLLQDEFAQDPAGLETVGHIRRSTEHLLQVVNDILDYSQLQSGQMVFFPSACELRPMVSETLELLQQRALEKGLTFKLDIAKDVPQQVWVDGPRLCQVLRHLVDNAVKFTHQGEVSVALALINHHLQIQVKDSGRGIPLQRQAHIFNRFESADLQTTKDFGGTGLGLSLCERLVVMQGGQIGVQSQPGSGALQVQLHAAWPQAKVTQASSGAQALALIQTQHFDLALVDMVMPDMDGLALTRALRQLPAPVHTLPIVALTAHTNPLDEQHCLEAGMDMVLHKPINPKAMARTISRAMALSMHRGRT